MEQLKTATEVLNFLLRALISSQDHHFEGIHITVENNIIKVETDFAEALIDDNHLVTAICAIDEIGQKPDEQQESYYDIVDLQHILKEHFPGIRNDFETELAVIKSRADAWIAGVNSSTFEFTPGNTSVAVSNDVGDCDVWQVSKETGTRLTKMLENQTVEYHGGLLPNLARLSKLQALILPE